MKIVGVTALHYGSDYLAAAIRSIIDIVDEYWILYSDQGSHGTRTDLKCPDNRETLADIATQSAGGKLRWHDGTWGTEGNQRDTIFQLAPDADLLISVDYDEIWQPGLPLLAVRTALESNIRHWRVPFRHYWRSFYQCILHDPAFPVRIMNMRAPDGENTLDAKGLAINHFGYAIRPDVMRYKWEIHGHKGQYRKDCDWMTDRYLNAAATTDLHPVGSQYWNVEHIDPWQYLPDWMHDHPYADKERIE